MPVSGTLVPTRVGASGEREWAQPVPDFDQPVRIRLLPDEDRARQTIDMNTIYGVELDTGSCDRTDRGSFEHPPDRDYGEARAGVGGLSIRTCVVVSGCARERIELERQGCKRQRPPPKRWALSTIVAHWPSVA